MGAPGAGCPLPANPMRQMARRLCCRIHDADEASIDDGDIPRIAQSLPECPPMRAQMEVSTMFMRFAQQDMPGTNCFRSIREMTPEMLGLPSTLRDYMFVSICCYETRTR